MSNEILKNLVKDCQLSVEKYMHLGNTKFLLFSYIRLKLPYHFYISQGANRMKRGNKKIASITSVIMGAFMMAAGSIAEAQETDVGVKETFSDKCGVVETRGQLYECTDFTSNEQSDYQAEIWDTAIKDKEVYAAVAKEYLDVLGLKDCQDSNSAGLEILEEMFSAEEPTAQEPLTGKLLDSAHIYFTNGKTCLAKTAEIYGQHESLKEIADKYRDLSDRMGEVSARLPVPKPQS